jgi:hypothetical protein
MMSSKDFRGDVTGAFNPKEWRRELYQHHKETEGSYPTHQHIMDKRDVKYTTYHCGEWTRKVRNPKKDAAVSDKLTTKAFKRSMRKAFREHYNATTLETINGSPKMYIDQEEDKKSDTPNWAWM